MPGHVSVVHAVVHASSSFSVLFYKQHWLLVHPNYFVLLSCLLVACVVPDLPRFLCTGSGCWSW